MSARFTIALLIASFGASYAQESLAYIGPGAGITMLGALWAVILAILLALGGLVVWPLRAYFRKKKRSKAAAGEANADETNVR